MDKLDKFGGLPQEAFMSAGAFEKDKVIRGAVKNWEADSREVRALGLDKA